MARQRKTPEAAQRAKDAADKVLRGRQLLGPMRRTKPKQKAFQRGISKVRAGALMQEIDEHIQAGDYSDLRPDHYVALYCWMHEAIYDVECVEETRREWNVAVAQVRRMLEEEFDNDEGDFLDYMRFSAKREEERELWRRSNRKPGRRLRWRDFFLLTTALADWRLHKARTEGTA